MFKNINLAEIPEMILALILSFFITLSTLLITYPTALILKKKLMLLIPYDYVMEGITIHFFLITFIIIMLIKKKIIDKHVYWFFHSTTPATSRRLFFLHSPFTYF